MSNASKSLPLALDAVDLGFSYGRNMALNGVSIQVPAGRFVGLIGANGAGKTTLFSIVTGLYAAHRGSISVTGLDLRLETSKALASIGVVFQRTTLDLDLSVEQNLHYAAALHGIGNKRAGSLIDEGLLRHGLSGLGKRKAGSLSGGQRRRVELARALLHKPSLLLLDEPTVGLDQQSRTEFVEHVKTLCTEQGTGVLWATHLLDEVSVNDRVFLLDRGQVIAKGELRKLQQKHQVDDLPGLYNKLLGNTL